MVDKPNGAMLKNVAQAPMIYFDSNPTIGLANNIVELDLSARALTLVSDGNVKVETICVAHLRCSIEAALNLRRGIDKALKMAHVDLAQIDKSNDSEVDPSPGEALRAKLQAMQ